MPVTGRRTRTRRRTSPPCPITRATTPRQRPPRRRTPTVAESPDANAPARGVAGRHVLLREDALTSRVVQFFDRGITDDVGTQNQPGPHAGAGGLEECGCDVQAARRGHA